MSHLVTSKAECIESSGNYGRFAAEPLERGFGITLGNALRRVLLSSLQGAAITWARIDGIDHEFSTIPNVKEDVTELLLNVRGIRLRSLTKQEGKLVLEADGERTIYAADIKPSVDFEIANPDLYLATLDSADARLHIEFNVSLGKGYVAAKHSDGLAIGTIPVDAIFTPVQKVNYFVEPVRTGEHVGLEILVMEVWTDGTISPIEAMNQSVQILREQLASFSALSVVAAGEREVSATGVSSELYEMPLEKLGLTPRVFNCLRRNKMSKVGELLERSEQDLLSMKKFGRKSLDELKESLEEKGLSLRWEDRDET